MPRKTKKGPGGKRPGAGRPPRGGALPLGTPQVVVRVRLTPVERDGLVERYGSVQAAVLSLLA